MCLGNGGGDVTADALVALVVDLALLVDLPVLLLLVATTTDLPVCGLGVALDFVLLLAAGS